MDKNKFLSKIKKTKTGCWEWTGTRSPYGYGSFAEKGKTFRAHRFSYELFKGPITKPEICHKCDNPPCVNPEHLFQGTRSENQRDSVAKKRHVNSKKTHCKFGHEMSGDNLITFIHSSHKTPARRCRTCSKRWILNNYYKKIRPKRFPHLKAGMRKKKKNGSKAPLATKENNYRERSNVAKLTAKQVEEIIRTYKRGDGPMLAKKYGVVSNYITRLARGGWWRDTYAKIKSEHPEPKDK